MRITTCFSLAAIAALTASLTPLNAQQPDPPQAAVPLVTKFYDVSQLIVAKPQYPFTGRLPASSGSTTTSSFSGGMGLGGDMGLGGGGGGGMGGGGGYFSVPPTALQFGGMQGGGFGGGGYQLGTSNPSAEADSRFIEEYSAEGIAQLLKENVALESWDDMGADGTVTALGNTLLVRQTVENHVAVADFLQQLTAAVVGVDVYQVEAWWIPANVVERRQLDEILTLAAAEPERIAALSSLCEDAGGLHGRLLCRERTTAHVASGQRRPLVVGSVPVVGGASALSQPIVNHVNIGLVLEVTVIPVAGYLSGQQPEAVPAEEVFCNLRTAITNLGEHGTQINRSGEIDRFEIGANVLESTCRVQVGVPLLVGTLTSVGIPPREGDDNNESAVVILVQRR